MAWKERTCPPTAGFFVHSMVSGPLAVIGRARHRHRRNCMGTQGPVGSTPVFPMHTYVLPLRWAPLGS